METITIENAQSFCAGYEAVKSGRITQELTNREIAKSYPQYNAYAFAQGIIDALANDCWRYHQVSAIQIGKRI